MVGLAEELLAGLEQKVAFDRASFSRLAAPGEIEIVAVRDAQSTGVAPSGFTVKLTEALGSEAVRAGLVVEVELASSDQPFDQLLHGQGYRHALRVPIGHDHETLGALAVVRRPDDPFAREEIDAVADLATGAGPRLVGLAAQWDGETA